MKYAFKILQRCTCCVSCGIVKRHVERGNVAAIYLSQRSFIYSIVDTDVSFFGLFLSLSLTHTLTLSHSLLALQRIAEAEVSRADADRLFIGMEIA